MNEIEYELDYWFHTLQTGDADQVTLLHSTREH
jgi:hypothetical protein